MQFVWMKRIYFNGVDEVDSQKYYKGSGLRVCETNLEVSKNSESAKLSTNLKRCVVSSGI